MAKRKNKKGIKSFNLRMKEEYKTKITDYIKLLSDNNIKTPEGNNIDTAEVMEEILAPFFKDKTLTKKFIDLTEAYYFDFNKLTEVDFIDYTYQAIATPSKPVINPDYIYILKKIPNNLDTFSAEYKTYCHDNKPYKHLGFYIYVVSEIEGTATVETETGLTTVYYLLFESDLKEKKIKIHSIPESNIEYYVNEVDYLETLKNTDYKLLNQVSYSIDNMVFDLFVSIDVMVNYKKYKDMEKLIEENNKTEEYPTEIYLKGYSEYYNLINKYGKSVKNEKMGFTIIRRNKN